MKIYPERHHTSASSELLPRLSEISQRISAVYAAHGFCPLKRPEELPTGLGRNEIEALWQQYAETDQQILRLMKPVRSA